MDWVKIYREFAKIVGHVQLETPFNEREKPYDWAKENDDD